MGYGSEACEEKEIQTHYHDCVASVANNIEAGVRHTLRACDVTVYCRCRDLLVLYRVRFVFLEVYSAEYCIQLSLMICVSE